MHSRSLEERKKERRAVSGRKLRTRAAVTVILLPRTSRPHPRSKLGVKSVSPVSTRTTHSRVQPRPLTAQTSENLDGTHGSQPLLPAHRRSALFLLHQHNVQHIPCERKAGEQRESARLNTYLRDGGEHVQRLLKPSLQRSYVFNTQITKPKAAAETGRSK